MSTALPPAPAGTEKRGHTGRKILLGIGAVIVLASIGANNADAEKTNVSQAPNAPTVPAPEAPPSTIDEIDASDLEVSAADVVTQMENMNPGTVQAACNIVEASAQLLGADRAYADSENAFAKGYGSALNPSADEVFAELMSRC